MYEQKEKKERNNLNVLIHYAEKKQEASCSKITSTSTRFQRDGGRFASRCRITCKPLLL